MDYEIKEAFSEIMEIPSIYRRDFIVNYLRHNMSKEESRQFLFKKTKADFMRKIVAFGVFGHAD